MSGTLRCALVISVAAEPQWVAEIEAERRMGRVVERRLGVTALGGCTGLSPETRTVCAHYEFDKDGSGGSGPEYLAVLRLDPKYARALSQLAAERCDASLRGPIAAIVDRMDRSPLPQWHRQDGVDVRRAMVVVQHPPDQPVLYLRNLAHAECLKLLPVVPTCFAHDDTNPDTLAACVRLWEASNALAAQ